jgi:hypothetical protein
MENSDKTGQKEFTPFQMVIKVVDEHIEVCQQQEVNNYQIGYITGLLKTRNSCAKLIEAERLELKEVFEAGQKDQKTTFDVWFNKRYESKEIGELSIEIQQTESEAEILEKLTKDESLEVVDLMSKPKRYLVFFTFIVIHFLLYTVFTLFYIVTFRFKRLLKLPKSAEDTKNIFRKKLKI